MKTKKSYQSPAVKFYGNVEQITFGSRNFFEDAFFGTDGTDGKWGPKCSKKDFGFACGS